MQEVPGLAIANRTQHNLSMAQNLTLSKWQTSTIGDSLRNKICHVDQRQKQRLLRQASGTARVGAAKAKCKIQNILQQENRQGLLNRKAAGRFKGGILSFYGKPRNDKNTN